MRPALHLLLAGALAVALALPAAAQVPAATSPRTSERHRQKQSAEQEREQLRKKLAELKEDIHRTEKAHSHAADALASSEAAISNANRALRELAAEQQQLNQRLTALTVSQQALETEVARQRTGLEKMLRESYVAGQDDRVRLLLSGDDPNRIARQLRYLGYVSAEQVKVIERLRENLAAIEANKAEAEQARAALEEIEEERREQKAVLEKEKAKRKALVGQLSGKLAAQRREAGSLARDEARLAALVERLTVLIAQQRKADEDAARRRAQAEQKAREREKERAAQKTPSRPAERSAEAPPAQAQTPAARPVPDPAPRAEVASGHWRGKLTMPVKGEVAASFGARRADGPNWKGLFIRAGEGGEVRAAAPGEVIFADWMRGFGNLMIVDHGGQTLTVYGNNQSLLKRPGDRVRGGEVIATVGNSGGNEQSGLYFETRFQGRAVDPLTWMNR